MSLKDFLLEFKRTLEYSDRDNPEKREPVPKKEPVRETDKKQGAPTEDYEKEQRQQIYGRRIETDPKTETCDKEFYSFRKPIYKDVVVLVIENSSYTRNYKEKILQIANKIVEANKECFFLLVRIGDDKKSYDILGFDKLNKDNIIDNWFTETMSQQCDYLEAIKYIEEYYRKLIIGFELWDEKIKDVKKYSIQNINVIFIGSGNESLDAESKKECMQILKRIKSKSRIKSIKYFCTLDSQTIGVAKLGFPVIGHIETDFYK